MPYHYLKTVWFCLGVPSGSLYGLAKKTSLNNLSGTQEHSSLKKYRYWNGHLDISQPHFYDHTTLHFKVVLWDLPFKDLIQVAGRN